MADLTHKASCRRFACAHGWAAEDIDPQVRDMQAWTLHDRAREGVFYCAARRRKLCRGIVSALSLTDADLREAGWTECPACGAAVDPGGGCPTCAPPGFPAGFFAKSC